MSQWSERILSHFTADLTHKCNTMHRFKLSALHANVVRTDSSG